MKKEITTVKIEEVIPNEDNPRYIKEDKFKKLVKSITEFPEMLDARPIVVDEKMVVLGGNMRLKACIEAGLKEVPIIIAKGWSEDKKREFIVKDNVGFGSWDWDILANEWNEEELNDWGLDTFGNWIEEELEAEEDDFEIKDDMQIDVVLADLIEIGEHRLLSGDNKDSE